MPSKVETIGIPGAGAALTLLGVGSIITAIIGPKLPVIKNLNIKALTALRVTAGGAGTAELAAGLAVLGYSAYKHKKGSVPSAEEDVVDRPERPGSEEEGRDRPWQPVVGEEGRDRPSQPVVGEEGRDRPWQPERVEDGITDHGKADLAERQQAFAAAVQEGDALKMEELLKQGDLDVNETITVDGRAIRHLLTVAVRGGHVEAVKLLLEQDNIDLTHKDDDLGLLAHAYVGSKIEVLKLLLEAGVSAEDDKYCLDWVLFEGQYGLVELLRERGCDINQLCPTPGQSGRRVIGKYFDRLDKQAFRALVDAGASLDFLHEVTQLRGDALRNWAFTHIGIEEEAGSRSSSSASEPLVDQDGVDEEKQKALIHALNMEDVRSLRTLLKEGGVDVNGVMPNSCPPKRLLTEAIERGFAEVVDVLLAQDGIDLSPDQGTDLFGWALCEDEIRERLLKAKMPCTGEVGSRVFEWIVDQERSDLVEYLIENGFQVNESYEGVTPLRAAYFGRSLAVFKALLKAGAEPESLRQQAGPDCKDPAAWALGKLGDRREEAGSGPSSSSASEGATGRVESDPAERQQAFVKAVQENNADEVGRLLADVSVDVNDTLPLGLLTVSPLHFAVARGYADVVRALLRRDDIKVESSHERSLLYFAWIGKHMDTVQELLKDKRVSAEGETELFKYLVKEGRADLLEALGARGFDMNASLLTDMEFQPIEYVYFEENEAVFEALVKLGVSCEPLRKRAPEGTSDLVAWVREKIKEKS